MLHISHPHKFYISIYIRYLYITIDSLGIMPRVNHDEKPNFSDPIGHTRVVYGNMVRSTCGYKYPTRTPHNDVLIL